MIRRSMVTPVKVFGNGASPYLEIFFTPCAFTTSSMDCILSFADIVSFTDVKS